MVPIVAEVRARTLEELGPLPRHAGEEYFLVTRGRNSLHTECYAPDMRSSKRATGSISTAPRATPTSTPTTSRPKASRPISTSNCARSRSGSREGKQRHNFGGRPRESGTHNHRASLLRSSVAPACSKRTAWGYGSRLALPPSLFELWRTSRLAGTTVLLVFTPFYAAATCFFGGKRP
jgi:hypothetical protein